MYFPFGVFAFFESESELKQELGLPFARRRFLASGEAEMVDGSPAYDLAGYSIAGTTYSLKEIERSGWVQVGAIDWSPTLLAALQA